jgi:hypothetical protein
VADVSNKNLSGPQRELIQWHSKLCINMNHVQELMSDRHYKIPYNADLVLPPILFTKNATARSCSVPWCLACGLSSQKLCSTNVKTSRAIPAKDGILKSNQYEPGDKVFTDQFVAHTPGQRLDGFGRDGPERSLRGGTLYTNAASDLFMWNARQVWEQARQLWVKQDLNKVLELGWSYYQELPQQQWCL